MAYVVGLTGGIGSGKSAAADEFARLGATVVDTDAIAHELTQAGGAAVPQVRRLFGDEYVEAGGAMDRARMRALAFRDAAARKRLEALLHPMIREESRRRIAAAAGPYAPRGVDNDDPTATQGYIIGTDPGFLNRINIRRISNPGGTPTMGPTITLAVSNTSMLNQAAMGSTTDVNTSDARLFSASIRKNKITAN